MHMKDSKKVLIKNKLLKPLIAAYFTIAAIEIIAEFYKDVFYIAISKPLLMPVLIAIYWCSAKDKNKNHLFLLALCSVFIANILLICSAMQCITLGSLFFLVYRILVIWMVFKIVKFPGYFPLIIGALPFLFIYLFVADVTYGVLGDSFWMFIFQGIFIIFFGGFCLGSYIIKPNTSNTYLLVSTMLFTAMQFILVIKIFYVNLNIFQPLAMFLYVIGQYLLYRFIVIVEKKRKRYQIINKPQGSELN